MYRFSFTTLIVLLLIGAGLPAARADDQATCADRNSPPDSLIAACGRLIASGKLTGAALATAYVTRGGAYFNKDQNDRAFADIDKAVQLNPRDGTSFFMRGLLYMAKGDLDRALPDLTRAIQIIPNHAAALSMRGAVYNQQKAFDQALADLNKALRFNPQDEAAYRFRGFSYEGKGELEKARDDFRKALSLDPNDELAARGVKRVEEQLARAPAARPPGPQHAGPSPRDQALCDLNNASAGADDVIAACSRLIASSAPGDNLAKIYLRRSQAYAEKRAWDDAIVDLSEVIRIVSAQSDAGLTSVLVTGRAVFRLQKGDVDGAGADVDQALALDPKNENAARMRATVEEKRAQRGPAPVPGAATAPASADDQAVCNDRRRPDDDTIPACSRLIASRKGTGDDLAKWFYVRGFALTEKRDYDRAIADFGEILRLKPDDPSALHERAYVFSQKNDPAGAIADYDRLIRLDRTDRDAWRGRGISYRAKEDYDRAIADLSEAIRLDPSDARTWAARGKTYSRKSDYDRAMADYDEAIRLDPENAEAFGLRGIAHHFRRDYDRAIADVTEAFRLDPSHPDSQLYFVRGLSWFGKRNYEGALADLNQSVTIDPAFSYGFGARALAFEANGRLEEALADYRRELSLEPNDADAAKNVKRLEEDLQAAEQRKHAAATHAGPAATSPAGAASTVKPQKRVALVIGNSAYQYATPLLNPANDASDFAGALRKLGFDVVEGKDLDRRGMYDAVRTFARKVDSAELGLFFYAGHGLQVDGRNYLVPVDAKLERAGDLALDAVEVGTVLSQMEGGDRVSLVFLDACRDNPFARNLTRSLGARSASVGRGLAPVNSGAGTLIAFATEPGNTASDGDDRNSPFTSALLKHVGDAGRDISIVMRRVRADVLLATNKKQTPWDHSSLVDDVILAR